VERLWDREPLEKQSGGIVRVSVGIVRSEQATCVNWFDTLLVEHSC
jgi:hypothetical protein